MSIYRLEAGVATPLVISLVTLVAAAAGTDEATGSLTSGENAGTGDGSWLDVLIPGGKFTASTMIFCFVFALCGKFRQTRERHRLEAEEARASTAGPRSQKDKPQIGPNLYTVCLAAMCCGCYDRLLFGSGDEAVVGFWDWFYHEHTLLSLFFAKDSKIVEVPCCMCCTTCCCIDVGGDDFTVRMRIFIFLFVMILNLFFAAETEEGAHGTIWYFTVTTFVLSPTACWLKAWVPRISAKLRRKHPRAPWVMASTILLITLLLTLRTLYVDAAPNRATRALHLGLKAYALQLYFEFFTLAWKYFCKNVCCPCCVPSRGDVYRWSEVGSNLRITRNDAAKDVRKPLKGSDTDGGLL